MNTITRFEIGTEYVTRFACDADTKITAVVVGRTDKMVKVVMDGKTISRKIRIHFDCEIFSIASYSMAPIFSADRPATATPADAPHTMRVIRTAQPVKPFSISYAGEVLPIL